MAPEAGTTLNEKPVALVLDLSKFILDVLKTQEKEGQL